MNDATFLLDESLTKLSEVHKYQTEMKSGEWLGASEDHRKEVQMNLHRAEQQALSYMSLGNATVHMMKYLTKELQTPFLIPEIVVRLAAMLNYNLKALVGPRCTELKVRCVSSCASASPFTADRHILSFSLGRQPGQLQFQAKRLAL